MNYNIYFDFTAIFGFAAMIYSVCYRKTVKTASGKFFLSLLIIGFISSIFDIVSVKATGSYMVMYVANFIYLFSRVLSGMAFCFYLIGITDNWHKFRYNWPILVLLLLPLIAMGGFLGTNHITRWVFYIEDGVYHRGILSQYGIIFVFSMVYLVTGLAFVIKYRHFFTREKFGAIISIYVTSELGFLIQVFVETLLLECFISCAASFFIMLSIERPDEIFEPEINLKKYSAFTLDATKAIETKKTVSVVFVKIINDSRINSQTSYKEQIDIRRNIGKILKETAVDFSIAGDFFWIGQGKFVAVLNNPAEENSEVYSTTIRRRLNVPIKCEHGIVDLLSNVSLVNCPENIDNFEMLTSFMDSFYRISTLLDGVFDLKNISSKKEFEIKMRMESILKNAFINDSFEIYFQPIYSVKAKQFKSAEALIRLNDKAYGYIGPELFLPEAEKSGVIQKIGDLVFDKVCKFVASKEFKRLGLEYIEINLSVAQSIAEDLPIRIMDAIKRYGIEPNRINLNITESNDSYAQKLMEDNIRILKEFGLTFSLDDYGSGYSSIDNVAKIPFDFIKLDRTLINSKDNPELKAILENSINMIRDMKRKIVVEGVETKEAFLMFEGYQCDYIQGYYFSIPLPQDAFIKFVVDNNSNSQLVEE